MVFIIFPVCVRTVRKFSESLDDATKKDFKKIEEKFKAYCKTTKNKENRFVSIVMLMITFKTMVLFKF